MKVTFPLKAAETDAVADRVAWHPVLPAGDLKAYKGRSVRVTEDYLKRACDETRRYYQDLAKDGKDYKRPVIVSHSDEYRDGGRRSGDIVDFVVKEYDGKPCLWLKNSWRPNAWDAIQDRNLEHLSVTILEEFTDPQTGRQYGPFIDEVSETAKPVIKDYHVAEAIDAETLSRVGLSLQEGGEMPEELGKQIDDLVTLVTDLSAAVGQVAARMESLESRIKAMEEGPEEEEPEEEEAEEGAEEEAPEEEPGDMAASEDEAKDPVILKLAELETKVDAVIRASEKNGAEKGDPGDMSLGGEELTQARALAMAKKEGLSGIEAVNKAKELMGGAR